MAADNRKKRQKANDLFSRDQFSRLQKRKKMERSCVLFLSILLCFFQWSLSVDVDLQLRDDHRQSDFVMNLQQPKLNWTSLLLNRQSALLQSQAAPRQHQGRKFHFTLTGRNNSYANLYRWEANYNDNCRKYTWGHSVFTGQKNDCVNALSVNKSIVAFIQEWNIA